MIAITEENFLPFNKIPKNKNLNSPDVVFYPKLFAGEINTKTTSFLNDLKYDTINYCIENKVTEMPEKIVWFSEESDISYVFSPEHMYGLQPRTTPAFIKCMKYCLEKLLYSSYNSCMVTLQNSSESEWINDTEKWSDNNSNIAIVFFGCSDVTLLFKHREKKKEHLLKLESGTLLVLRANFLRNWLYKIKLTQTSQCYRLIFSYISETMRAKMPIAKKTCLVTSRANTSLESLYLNMEERRALIDKIRKTVENVSKVHGKNCVNGTKADLLKQLELKKLLGRGSFGNVYSACAPTPCDDESYQFAIKLASIDNASFKTPFVTNKKMWHEAYILRYMINPILNKGICPNLPLTADMFTCSECDFILPVRQKGVTKIDAKKSACLIILTELATGGDMVSWLESTTPRNLEDFYSALFQIMAGLHTLQEHLQILNNDIKAANILTYNVEKGGYWKYIVHGKEFYVPNQGKIFIINDFGVSISYNIRHKLAAQRTSKWCPLGQRYAMIINGEYSPLEAKKEHDIKGKEIPPYKLNWGFMSDKIKGKLGGKTWESVFKSNGGSAFISYKSDKINDPDIEFTEEQKRILENMNIPADSKKEEFYQNPEVIPPFELRYDTQDAIRIFTGGKRTTQPMFHKVFDSVPSEMVNNLKPYLTESFQYNFIDHSPSKHFAGYFIEDFFTRVHDYSKKPSDDAKILGEFRITP